MTKASEEREKILKSEVFINLARMIGQEIAEEYVDFCLDCIEPNMKEPITTLAKQINHDLIPQLAVIIPPPLIMLSGLENAMTTIEVNMFVWGAFIYRRWLIQGGADMYDIEEAATKQGKITL